MKRFIQKFPVVFEICEELRGPFHIFMENQSYKKKFIRFTKIKQIHVNFMKKIMKDPKLRNLTVDQKTRRFNEQFATDDFKISRFTI